MAGDGGGDERNIPGQAGAFVDDEGDPTATANDGVQAPAGSRGTGRDSPWSCEYQVEIEDDGEFAIFDFTDDYSDIEREYSETGRWLQQECMHEEGGGPVQGLIPEGGEVDLEALALEALEAVSVPAPSLGTSPPADSAVVHVPTWLWIDGDWWVSYSATASAGRVTATATASPVRTSWAMGDGATVACAGPGVAWEPGLGEDATDCSHTYSWSSQPQERGVFDVSATVELSVSWTANTPGGEGGGLGVITSSSSADLRVREIQAIETR